MLSHGANACGLSVGRHPDIAALLLGPVHVGTTAGAGGQRLVAAGARWRRTLPLARSHRHLHAGEGGHDSRCPAVEFLVCFAGQVIGAIEVQPLVVAGRGARQHRPQLRPVREEGLVHALHVQSVVPEVDEHADAVSGDRWKDSLRSSPRMGPKTQGRTRRPWGQDDRTPDLPVWAAVRWVVLDSKCTRRGVEKAPLGPAATAACSRQEGRYHASVDDCAVRRCRPPIPASRSQIPGHADHLG